MADDENTPPREIALELIFRQGQRLLAHLAIPAKNVDITALGRPIEMRGTLRGRGFAISLQSEKNITEASA